MGGHQVTSHGSGDDGFDEDGYDESQRAEIIEATRDGPTDGTVITDLDPDIDVNEEVDDEDELLMGDGQVAAQDDDSDQDEDDIDEDIVQDDFDDGTADAAVDLDDADDIALKP